MITQEKIQEFMNYNKRTGIVSTKCEVTKQSSGNTKIKVYGLNRNLKDMIYLYVHGELPLNRTIKFINGNDFDFRIKNLTLGYNSIQQRDKDARDKLEAKNLLTKQQRQDKEDNRLRVKSMFDQM